MLTEWKQSQVQSTASGSEGDSRSPQRESEGADQERKCGTSGALQDLRQVQLPDFQTGKFGFSFHGNYSHSFFWYISMIMFPTLILGAEWTIIQIKIPK